MGVTVVYSTLTKHVLGAIDRAGSQAGPVPLPQLVRAALPLRRSVTLPDPTPDAPREVLVPVDQLATATADQAPGLMTTPMAYGVRTGRALEPLSPWSGGATPTVLKQNGLTITLDRTSKGVATPVLVVLAGPSGTLVLTGQVFRERKMVTIGVALQPNKSYAVLTLAAGWHGRLEAVQVT